MAGPLDGIRVVDCTRGTAGPRLTQLFADYGAEVAWIEPPGGDPYRDQLAVDYAVFNRSKRSVVLDLKDPAGVERLRQLAASADVFVQSWRPGTAERLGLGPDALRAVAPGLVYCSISGFGAEGPWRDVPGHEALVHALVGTMAEQVGMREPPIFEGIPFASIGAAYLAATGVLAALYRRHLDGAGRHVETSLLDGALSYLMMLWGSSDRGAPPHLPGGIRLVARSFECSDGEYIGVHTGAVGAFGRLMKVLGLDDRIPASETGHDIGVPLTPEQVTIVNDEIPNLFLQASRDEWVRKLLEADICAIENLRAGEIFDQPQPRHNDMVLELDDPTLGPLQQVAPAAAFAATPHTQPTPAPTVGADTDEVLGRWTDRRSEPAGEPSAGPLLAGVRVLDLGAYYAGPYSSRLLADLGADVIKLEPLMGDQLRGLTIVFRSAQAGKRSISANLKEDALTRARTGLIEWADVVHHNMRPGAAERLGLGYDDTRAINPRVVYLYAPGWGSTGPHRLRQSFAPKLSGYVGAAFEVGGQFNPPLYPTGNEDPGNGLLGAVAALMALVHRQRSGQGQYVENSQLNATMTHVAHIVRRPDGEVLGAERLDPVQLGFSALERLYQTADGWICLVVKSQRELDALRTELDPALADDRFATIAACAQADDELAVVIDRYFTPQSSRQVVEQLSAAGVPVAEPVVQHNSVPFLRDPDNVKLGRVAVTPHERDGNVYEIDQLIRISQTEPPVHRVAPDLGAHTDEILAWLGYDDAEITALRDRGAIR
jgi:crotonobetainyl-CoA:carnitine CoA-transferase CaiB-like acyl-CoA transferase